jgi:hypothetical protein
LARDGSGTFGLAEAPFVNGTTIDADVMNSDLSDIAAGLTQSLSKDGQTVPTASLPMAGFKHTNVGAATDGTNYVRADQISGGNITGVDDSGTANVYAIAPAIPITAYVKYQRFQFFAGNANTGASTLAVSGLSAKNIVHLDGTALQLGDIPQFALADVEYDGTRFMLLSASGVRGMANTWPAAQTFSSAITYGGVTLSNAVTGTGAMVLGTSPTITTALQINGVDNGSSLLIKNTGGAKWIDFKPELSADTAQIGYWNGSSWKFTSFAGNVILQNALTYGGVTLTNAVTGTGKMVLDASPVLSGADLGTTSFAHTQSPGTNNTTVATTAYVDASHPRTAQAVVSIAAGVATVEKQTGFTSVVRTADGEYECTLSSAMPDVHYTVLFTCAGDFSGGWIGLEDSSISRTTTIFHLTTSNTIGPVDCNRLNIKVFA